MFLDLPVLNLCYFGNCLISTSFLIVPWYSVYCKEHLVFINQVFLTLAHDFGLCLVPTLIIIMQRVPIKGINFVSIIIHNEDTEFPYINSYDLMVIPKPVLVLT